MRTLLIVLAVVILPLGAYSMASKDAAPFEGWNKLDTKARAAWNSHDPSKDEWLEAIVGADVDIKKKHQAALTKAGFVYRSIILNFATGRIMIKNMDDLTKLKFVKSVEGSTSLSKKKK